MSNKQGQTQSLNNEECLLPLSHDELKALRTALRIEYTGLRYLATEDSDWIHELSLIESVLNKVHKAIADEPVIGGEKSE